MNNGKRHDFLYDIKLILFLFGNAIKVSKSFGIMMVLSVALKSLLSIIWVILPKYIFEELTGLKRMNILLTILCVFMAIVFIIDCLGRFFEKQIETNNEKIMLYLNKILANKIMEIDYEYLENPGVLDLKEKAQHGLEGWGSMYPLVRYTKNMLSSALTVAALACIVVSMSPILAVLLVLIVIYVSFISEKLRKIVYKFWDKLSVFNRRFGYLVNLMFDFKYGKDIRLYNMKDMLLEKNQSYIDETHNYYKKQGRTERKYIFQKDYAAFLQMLLIYGFSVYLMYTEKIQLSSFVMYIAAANSIVSSSTDITESFIGIKRVCQYTSPFYEFCNLPVIKAVGVNPVTKADKWMIEFKNVSFIYPGSTDYTLKNVSIKISPSEKLSIVGLNGAGKTTFVKLLLRLYDPVEGSIMLNGADIKTLDYNEYLKLFSVVFQDYSLFAGSVAENIAIKEVYDEIAVADALEKVGLQTHIDALPNKLNTQILKIFDENGTEFSGGQNERLAIARAVYKDAPIAILDEPTAALDPISEYEIYQNFDKLINSKTTVYISHRLSTCRFCDEIAVFKDGEIIQLGAHNELLADENDLYSKMWQAQSQYYV